MDQLKLKSPLVSSPSFDALPLSGSKIPLALFKREHQRTNSLESVTSSPRSSQISSNQDFKTMGVPVHVKGYLGDHFNLCRLQLVQELSTLEKTTRYNPIWIMRFNALGDYLACGRNDGSVLLYKALQASKSVNSSVISLTSLVFLLM